MCMRVFEKNEVSVSVLILHRRAGKGEVERQMMNAQRRCSDRMKTYDRTGACPRNDVICNHAMKNPTKKKTNGYYGLRINSDKALDYWPSLVSPT